MATLDTQEVKFNQVSWSSDNGNSGSLEVLTLDSSGTAISLATKPSSVATGDPYWMLSFRIGVKGLEAFDISVHESQGAGTHEPVMDKITFDGFEVDFEGGGTATFDFSNALSRTDSKAPILKVGMNGVKGADRLFQKGIYLKLCDDLAGQCECEVELSMVFRGPMNDNDPAGMARAMKCWPEISFKWLSGGTKKVSKFRATVKPVVETQMFAGLHAGHGSAALNESVANFFTDRTVSVNPLRATALHNSMLVSLATGGGALTGGLGAAIYTMLQTSGIALPAVLPAAAVGGILGAIVGTVGAVNFPDWANIFDMRHLDMKNGRGIKAVYGPLDGANPEGTDYFSQTRDKDYDWSTGILQLVKAPRQGFYDNTHIHGKMSHLTKNGDVQSHAPFCVHSCMHTHWRWSGSNVNIAMTVPGIDSDWFRGWSSVPPFESNSTRSAPLIPPNQSLKVSITNPGATAATDTSALDLLKKLVWYEVEIQKSDSIPFDAGVKQVIMGHGMGWAFQYGGPGATSVTQQDLSDFFHWFYDLIRYFDSNITGTAEQIPDGTYTGVSSGTPIKMEDL